ncbi:LeuA1 [Desulforapulum autotrophicum HRM2]|uniref:2-isopropylmalate synthase n=2 Tax=Desulforapulum autotrophicum TaxID=2296 RepID=C0QM22_DESAH|nr:LeuA1 [Desulforapulum autotrophicum HRM2]
MQHRGMVFSSNQAMTVLNFQERLGVDICQAGYPPAHESEQAKLKHLSASAVEKGYSIRVAAMGRACLEDVQTLSETGTLDFHLHAHVSKEKWNSPMDQAFPDLGTTVETIRANCPGSQISLAFLDIGRTDPEFLSRAALYLIKELALDILSLPDTSGIMGPNQVHDAIAPIARLSRNSSTRLAVHCHNDLGMASANTVMGVVAGATVVEASVFGLGERNGLADLYTTARVLKDQGYALDLRLEDVDTFREYYRYIDGVCRQQTGEPLLTYNTPFFGDGVKTHVAGTHGGSGFGLGGEEKIFLNVLCGQRLVKQYLDQKQIPHDLSGLASLTQSIKRESARLHRRLEHNEIAALAAAPALKNWVDENARE